MSRRARQLRKQFDINGLQCDHRCHISAVKAMASVTIRDLPDETYRALWERASSRGLTVEAEILAILESAVPPKAESDLALCWQKSVAKLEVSILRLSGRIYKSEKRSAFRRTHTQKLHTSENAFSSSDLPYYKLSSEGSKVICRRDPRCTL